MTILIYLIPVALLLGGLGLAAFLWALRSGQYEDLDVKGLKRCGRGPRRRHGSPT